MSDQNSFAEAMKINLPYRMVTTCENMIERAYDPDLLTVEELKKVYDVFYGLRHNIMSIDRDFGDLDLHQTLIAIHDAVLCAFSEMKLK